MTDFIWPVDVIPTESEWTLVDYSAVFTGTFGGGVRTVSRGQRWSCTLRFLNRGGPTAALIARRESLLAFLALLRGRANRVWLNDAVSDLRGSLAAPELLTNGSATSAVTPWVASNSELVLSADPVNGLRLARTAVAADRTCRQGAVTTVNAARYAFRGLFTAARGSLRAALAVGTTNGGAESLAGTTRTTAGRYVESFAAGATTSYPSIFDYVSGRSAGDFWHAQWMSLARCGRVSTTAAAAASTMLIKDLPTSTAGLVLAGTQFEVGGELHRLTANLDSDGSGIGFAMFEPALRSSQAADVPVIFTAPMGRFVLAEDASWTSRAGRFSDATLTFLEA